jgi:excisionase family DNA binding protein
MTAIPYLGSDALEGGESRMPASRAWLRAAEVAARLQVSPKTVSRWAKDGRLPYRRTLGGHRRYPEAAIRELVASLAQEVSAS